MKKSAFVLLTALALCFGAAALGALFNPAGTGSWYASLLVPYLAWISYAGYLNVAIWLLNPVHS